MLWYGTTLNFKKNFKKKKIRKRGLLCLLTLKKINKLNTVTLKLYKPSLWRLIYLTSKKFHLINCVYLYSSHYYFKFNFYSPFSNYYYDKQTQLLYYQFQFSPNCLIIYKVLIFSILTLFSLPFFVKLKFKGKGYYVFKNKRNTIAPRFGFSHRVYIYAYSVILKFLTKNNYFFIRIIKKGYFSYTF